MRSHLLLVLFGALFIGCNQTAEKSDTTADLVAQCEAAVNCYQKKQAAFFLRLDAGDTRPYDEYSYELTKTDNLKYKAECLITEINSAMGLEKKDSVTKTRLGYTGTKWEWIESTSKHGDKEEGKVARGSGLYKTIMGCFNK